MVDLGSAVRSGRSGRSGAGDHMSHPSATPSLSEARRWAVIAQRLHPQFAGPRRPARLQENVAMPVRLPLARDTETESPDDDASGGVPRISLLAFFEAEAKRHDEQFRLAQATAFEGRKQLPALQAEVAAAKRALDDKRDLKARAEREGLETAKLDAGIADLQSQLDAAAGRLAACTGHVSARRTFDREIALARSLASEFYVREAIEVTGIRDCYAHVVVRVSEEDRAGEPTAIELLVGGRRVMTFAVAKTKSRVSASFRPKALAWVPLQPEKPDTYQEHTPAFFDRSRGLVILPTFRRPSHDQYAYGGQAPGPADIVVSLEDHVRGQWGDVQEIDLDRAYAENELAEVVRNKTLALTVASGPFRPSEERLTSGDIALKIKDDWSAFAACPWAGDVKGPLALLKYHVENGEKARFWSEEYEGQFGFRLRTRDHTWIVGDLFIVPGEPPPGRQAMKVAPTREAAIASLGRLHLRVVESG